jgi:hypothetical protein
MLRTTSSELHKRSSSRGAVLSTIEGQKENNPIAKLSTLGTDKSMQGSSQFSTFNIKKKINSFDTGMKQDFSKLEDKIVRCMKRN